MHVCNFAEHVELHNSEIALILILANVNIIARDCVIVRNSLIVLLYLINLNSQLRTCIYS